MTAAITADINRTVRVQTTSFAANSSRVLLFSAHDDRQQLIDSVQTYRADGALVTAFLKNTGSQSQWCSQNDVYYYLYKAELGRDPNDYRIGPIWLLITAIRLAGLIRSCDPVAVVCIGHSPYLVAARLAAWLACASRRVSISYGTAEAHIRNFEKIDRKISTLLVSDSDQLVLGKSGTSSFLRMLAFAPFCLWSVWIWLNLSREIYVKAKRIGDCLVAAGFLTAFAPWIGFKAVWLAASARPAFGTVEVVGKGNVTFRLYKFSDTADSFDSWKFIDWLPSLINVVRGELSFVGSRLLKSSSEQSNFKWIAPGMVSWAEVRALPQSSDVELCALDAQYMDGISLQLDCKILALAVVRAVRHR